MKAAMLGHDAILAGSAQIVVAGGMESMSNAPYLLNKARSGYRMGHGAVYDHMFLDGLEDAYDRGTLMGKFAEDTAEKYQFTRQMQDAFATESLMRAKKATGKPAPSRAKSCRWARTAQRSPSTNCRAAPIRQKSRC